MESSLSIKEVSQRTGLSAHTLRYYERIGLLAPVSRSASGQRRYLASDMDWLDFLLRLRTTGMPIHRMQEFARLRSEGNTTARPRRELLESHLAGVLANIQALQQSAQALQVKIGIYRQMENAFAQNVQAVEGKNHDANAL